MGESKRQARLAICFLISAAPRLSMTKSTLLDPFSSVAVVGPKAAIPSTSAGGTPLRVWVGLLAILVVGMALRIAPWHGYPWIGFDENLYKAYVEKLDARGVGDYPAIAEEYIVRQHATEKAFLPPTRFLYIFCSATWRAAFYGDAPYQAVKTVEDVKSDPTLKSLRAISTLASCLTLLVAAVFARRLAGDRAMLGVTALLACAPTQLHMAQHGLIDGFFAFWALSALWLLWENLQLPDDPRWLAAYTVCLALLVLTKENAAFAMCALCGTTLLAHFAGWGRVTRKLVLVTIAGPTLGLAILVTLAGGIDVFFVTYKLLVIKAHGLKYAIATGDGPWFRYLVDLLLASPLTLLLAVGAALQLRKTHAPLLFATAFIACSYVVMCNVKYGMNLRYANMWDMPLRLLAFTQVGWIAERFPARRANLALGLFIGGLCLFDLHQYQVLFVNFDRDYEMITSNLMQALKILNFMALD
jgi:hypothetical protein